MTGLAQPVAGEVLVSGAELWWRQCPVGPAFYDEEKGQPSDLMFRWTDADGGKLSGARATSSTAEEAYDHRTVVEKKASAGTWGLPASTANQVSSQLIDDSANLPAPPASPPGHTYLDVRHVSLEETKAAKKARNAIRSRLLIASKKHHPTADTSEAEPDAAAAATPSQPA